jgi:hypothetical protein
LYDKVNSHHPSQWLYRHGKARQSGRKHLINQDK